MPNPPATMLPTASCGNHDPARALEQPCHRARRPLVRRGKTRAQRLELRCASEQQLPDETQYYQPQGELLTTGELSRWTKGRVATAGVVAATVLSLVGCAQQGIAVAQPRFDTVPDDCAFALAPARTEIARFAGDLREPDDDIETDHDSERHDTTLHVRCWEIFNGTHRAPLDADEVALHRSTRDLIRRSRYACAGHRQGRGSGQVARR